MHGKYLTYKDFNEQQISDIATLYTERKLTTTQIGELYGVGRKVIAKILDKLDIERDKHRMRKSTIDVHYFDDIDTREKAYYFGLLYADGCNEIYKSTVTISLEENDKHILESLREALGIDMELKYIDYTKVKNKKYSSKNQYKLSIYSSEICKQLNSKGLIMNKSLNLKYPESLDDKYFKDFFRGYFDGNGSFSLSKLKSGKLQSVFSITSTYSFCKSMREKLLQELDIPGGGIYDSSCHNNITSVLTFSGNRQVKTILDWLYDDSEVYLERKYQKYVKLFIDNPDIRVTN